MDTKQKHKEGISLRTVYLWLVIVTVAIAGIMVYITFHLTSSFLRMSDATDTHISLERAAKELMDASDYLTEKAQRFTGTGNMQFLEEYFTEAEETARREKALDIMDDDPLYEPALKYLQKALNASRQLQNQEYYGMMLVIKARGYLYYPDVLKNISLSGADSILSEQEKMRRATELLLSDEYYDLKNNIRTCANHSLKEVENLTRSEKEASLGSLRRELDMVRVIILLQTAGVLLMVLLTSRLGITPILKAVEKIREDDILPEIGSREFRYLAKAYNRMYDIYRKSLENLNFKASHDELTGAYNRAGYDLLLSSLDLSESYMLFFDVDKFKEINDTFGHQTGDGILKRFVQVLKKNFRSDDYVCRIGGDEFCVLMVHAEEKWRDLVSSKVDKIQTELNIPKDDLPGFTVSCGIAHGSHAKDAATLVRMADAALYKTKKNGRNGYSFADP